MRVAWAPRNYSISEVLELLQIVENRRAPRRPILIQRGVLRHPAAGWVPRRFRDARGETRFSLSAFDRLLLAKIEEPEPKEPVVMEAV